MNNHYIIFLKQSKECINVKVKDHIYASNTSQRQIMGLIFS